MIVLPNTDERGALQIAKQVWSAVSNQRISHEASPFGVVTISAGCATITPSHGVVSSQLVDCADRGMYEAKRHGRNCVCSSGDLGREIGPSLSSPIMGMKPGS